LSKFYIPCKCPESWKEFLAGPDKQWKKGYSARALAYCWEEAGGFPKSVTNVFNTSGISLFNTIEFVLGIPEHSSYPDSNEIKSANIPARDETSLTLNSAVC
jgi:hypothetical protein